MTNDELRSFYREQMPRIYKFFYYKTLSRTRSEDMTSDTFVRFLEKTKAADIQDKDKYIWGVAYNVFQDFLRQKYESVLVQFDEEIFDEYANQYIEERESATTLEERILPFIAKLPQKQKEIATLRLIEKNSLSDICLILNKDMNYVKTTQKRAIRKLKELVACTP
ncbi:MAG: sigma-70 family RNA polymerase sigma factor [Candidatus Dojkabacteria bacterium]|nr:MAG: sigma-70 family RNA polymerase sigma factor [Candidatus Dojkabacteria bacterium]